MLDKILTKISLVIIRIYQKTFSSHTWIFKDILYTQLVCAHSPHCSEYGKNAFKRYGFKKWLKYTMNRINKCTPDTKIKYDPFFYKVIFFSSAPIWIPFLDELYNDKRFEIVGVITWEDKKSNRWQKLKPNIIKQHSIEKLWINKELIKTPWKIKENKEFEKWLKQQDADFFVIISYGKILPKEILDIPKLGPINIHWSILPKYRWASPIQSVFLNKEKETWITIMYMNENIDTWDVIKILKIPLTKQDNTKTLIDKFTAYSPKFTVDTIWDFWKWDLKRIMQDESKATYCKKFTKQDGKIDFHEPAEKIYNKFQAFYLWPKIYTNFNSKKLDITDCFFENKDSWKKIWEWFKEDNQLKVQTWKWNLIVKKVKLEWKKEINAKDFYNGYLKTIL